jgi:hypothetical protein
MVDEYKQQAESEAVQYVSVAVIATNRVAISPYPVFCSPYIYGMRTIQMMILDRCVGPICERGGSRDKSRRRSSRQPGGYPCSKINRPLSVRSPATGPSIGSKHPSNARNSGEPYDIGSAHEHNLNQ